MRATKHKITHQYQPTGTACSPTALSMLLGYYGRELSVSEISDKVPQVQNDKGENQGTINTQMAVWCLSQDFRVKMYSFDCQVVDQSWADFPQDKLVERLELRKKGWVVPALGKAWTAAYAQSYIDFIRAGGELHIQPAVTSKLLYELLIDGPVLPCLSFSTLHGAGRDRIGQNDTLTHDDINGRAMNHSVVVYGYDEKGNFLVADPQVKPGLHLVEPDRMIAAISTGQIECDNLLFQLEK